MLYSPSVLNRPEQMGLDQYEIIESPELSDGLLIVQCNKRAGTIITFPELPDDVDWEGNRARALSSVFAHGPWLEKCIRVKPTAELQVVDLHKHKVSDGDTIGADSVIVSDPGIVMNVNPADCGELALSGFSPVLGKGILALIHTGRAPVEAGVHTQTVNRLTEVYRVDPTMLNGWLSPHIKAVSYLFPRFEGKLQDEWEPYAGRLNGIAYIDVQRRLLTELAGSGVREDSIAVSPVDTFSNPDFYSNAERKRDPSADCGANALFVSLKP